MPRTLPIEELDAACVKGRQKVNDLVAAWPDTLSPQEKQNNLRQIYGEMVTPIHKLLENFDPDKYQARDLRMNNARSC